MALFEAHYANREAAILANTLALTYLGMGSVVKAHRYARQARQEAETLGETTLLAPITNTEAQIAMARGDWQGAIGLATRSVGYATEDGNSHALIEAFRTRARAQATAGSQREALADYEQAADAARAYGSRLQQRTVLTELGDLLLETGNPARAGRIFREALLMD
jgi:tetratricopeptide (TPR) repeat protein